MSEGRPAPPSPSFLIRDIVAAIAVLIVAAGIEGAIQHPDWAISVAACMFSACIGFVVCGMLVGSRDRP